MLILWLVHSLSRFLSGPKVRFEVVANAVTALSDIHVAATSEPSTSGEPQPGVFNINTHILSKLLIALNECTEWGRVSILTALSRYKAQDDKESEHICERVVPQFQHANASVVLAAVKVIIQLLILTIC